MFRALCHVVRRHWPHVLGGLLNLTPIAWAGELLVGIVQGLSARNRQFSLLIRRARGARPPAVASEAGRALLGVRDLELPRPDVRLVVALRAFPLVLAVENGDGAATRGLPAALLAEMPRRRLIVFRDHAALARAAEYEDLLAGTLVWLGDLASLLAEDTAFDAVESLVGFGDVKIAATIDQAQVIRHPVIDDLAEIVYPDTRGSSPLAVLPPNTRTWPRTKVVTLVVVISAMAPTQVASAPARAGCPEVFQLNILTTPEMLGPLNELASEFERWGPHCARLFVSAAPAQQTITWLRNGWPAEALRNAPQPHVWIPESTLEVHQTQGGNAHLTPLGSVASSPIVLAASGDLADKVKSEGGFSWSVVHRLLVNRPAGTVASPVIVRPNPRGSGAGILITAMLYRTAFRADENPETIRGIEQSLLPLLPGRNELCTFAGAPRPHMAALTSEVSARGQRCAGLALEEFTADEESPRLDYPFVQVSWPGYANSERRRIAADLHTFLLQPGARRVFVQHRLRGPVPTPALDREVVTTTLRRWEAARRRVRILAVVDVSAPMSAPFGGTKDSRMASVTTLLRRSLGSLTPKDQVGVWAVPGGDGPHDEIVPMRSGPPAGPPRLLMRTRSTGPAAELPETLTAGLRLIDRLPDGRPVPIDALLLITHGQDVSLVAKVPPTGFGSVFVIALSPGACAARSPFAEITRDTRGSCHEATHYDDLTQAFEKVAGALWGGAPTPG
ncbi:hypothetical protein [Nonomuraea endophytica]|uniref:hypothetical protein n=1 Tax=Nonomuraea endophytica TaxID=714136 RepID=UPI0037C7064D